MYPLYRRTYHENIRLYENIRLKYTSSRTLMKTDYDGQSNSDGRARAPLLSMWDVAREMGIDRRL